MLHRFRSLFTGGEYGYGEWVPPNKSKTISGPTPLEAYERHLDGKVGLGQVPVTKAGTCNFAAIDIDIDNIDHAQLFEKVVKRHLPLNICRSKSGGAHLYLFPKTPLSSSQVQALLRRWATLLGYPSVEIFPKQISISSDNIGNWINLPYFGSDNTTRYAISHKGALSLEQFLDTVKWYDPENSRVDETNDAGSAQMPPCLAALSQHKLPEGSRNSTLFNVAVFYRKSSPANWETEVARHNQEQFEKPLEYREVQTIVKSAGRARYQYTCEQSPIKDYCDRAACQLLPYGIGHMPWKEQGAYDDLLVGHLRKVSSEPPRYIVEVNGNDLELSADDFINFNHFRRQVYIKLDLMVRPLKQPQWDLQIRGLTLNRENILAPDDASTRGLIIERFHEFIALRHRSINREDILRGLPVTIDGLVLFRASDLRRHLQIYKLDKIDMGELFLILKTVGLDHRRLRISGKLLTVWSFPAASANAQTEDFEVPEFEKEETEEL